MVEYISPDKVVDLILANPKRDDYLIIGEDRRACAATAPLPSPSRAPMPCTGN